MDRPPDRRRPATPSPAASPRRRRTSGTSSPSWTTCSRDRSRSGRSSTRPATRRSRLAGRPPRSVCGRRPGRGRRRDPARVRPLSRVPRRTSSSPPPATTTGPACPISRAGTRCTPGSSGPTRRSTWRRRTIHAIGLEETERIDAEFRELGGRLLGTTTSRRPSWTACARTRSSTSRRRPRCSPWRRSSLARANAAIPDWFGRLPSTPCVVVEMGRARGEVLDDRLLPPARRGRQPARELLHQHLPRRRRGRATRRRCSRSTRPFRATISRSRSPRSSTGLPAFRRLGGPTAYIEGWGLYSERLSVEMGLLSGDLDRFGVASFDAWRACRLVVDTGLHALGWSRDRAIGFMLEHTALAENNIVNEVDRYLAMPGQALAYKLGQREILRLRAEARAALGDAVRHPRLPRRRARPGRGRTLDAAGRRRGLDPARAKLRTSGRARNGDTPREPCRRQHAPPPARGPG